MVDKAAFGILRDSSKYFTVPINSEIKHNGVRMEGIRLDVSFNGTPITLVLTVRSYNRYLAVAARVVRRSLKEQPRLQAERRGEMDLRFAKWQVSVFETHLPRSGLMYSS